MKVIEESTLLPVGLLVSLAWIPVLPQPEASPADMLVEYRRKPSENLPAFRLTRQPVADGAELITLFGKLQDPAPGADRLDVPILSVLRDTLGDNGPTRLRNVWILTSTRPTPLQRFASLFSFLCFRTGGKHHSNRVPAPVLDLAAPEKTVWPSLLGRSLQATELDPLGKLVRSSTRSYSGNFSDYRKLHLYQALGALDSLERSEQGRDVLPDSQLHEIYARLRLSDHTFGGLVRREKLSTYYDKETSRRQQTLGHNWELLRQRAEEAGLYFQPLALPGAEPALALLWVARKDLDQRKDTRFDRQFLNIANPWTDERLDHWTGYTQVRYIDAGDRSASSQTPPTRPVEMIPLALYSLDHPKAPFLLADFRDSLTPKRNELVSHGASSVVTGVFGITRFGSWPFFVGDSAVMFVRARHGAAVNRSARLEAYADAREFLQVDSSLDPQLKTELLRRLDHLALNPLENGISVEATVAKEQYAALVQFEQSQRGMAKLERDRRNELDSYTKSRAHRLLAVFGRIFARPFDPDIRKPNIALRAELASYRRASQNIRFLEQVLASGPRPEVMWGPDAIRQSVEALNSGPTANPRAARLVARVFASSEDAGLRFSCLRALQRLDVQEAHNELWRISQDPATQESWRAISLLYLNGDTSTAQAGTLGGGQ